MGLVNRRRSINNDSILESYLPDNHPKLSSLGVLIGTPGPAQKATIQLWENDTVVGYIKYAEKPAAQMRLAQEHSVLSSLPPQLAPRVLKFAPLLKGQALLTTAIVGSPLRAKLPPHPTVRYLLTAFEAGRSVTIDAHPWIRYAKHHYDELPEAWLAALESRLWPVVFHHGDFAPWNIIHRSSDHLMAIDWEYGTAEGFPYLDLAYYLLQVAALIYRWSPKRARLYAERYLSQKPWPGLTLTEAEAIINLTAFHAYHQARLDGNESTAPLQLWRRAIWENA